MNRIDHHFRADLERLAVPLDDIDTRQVTDEDLVGLPPPTQDYLRFMGVVGRPRDWSFRARFVGRFRRAPDARWMPCDAWQYNTKLAAPTRVFDMKVGFGGIVPMFASDTYEHGRGEMHGKLLDLVTVADGSRMAFDLSELVTYLNDALMVAPSMLLDPTVTWTPVGPHSFDVSLSDAVRTVTGRVDVDREGRLVDFSTSDRWCALPHGPVRARWNTPVESWTLVEDRPLPQRAAAIWQLPGGPFRYAEAGFVAGTVMFNVPPTDAGPEPSRPWEWER